MAGNMGGWSLRGGEAWRQIIRVGEDTNIFIGGKSKEKNTKERIISGCGWNGGCLGEISRKCLWDVQFIVR